MTDSPERHRVVHKPGVAGDVLQATGFGSGAVQ